MRTAASGGRPEANTMEAVVRPGYESDARHREHVRDEPPAVAATNPLAMMPLAG